MAIQDIYQAVLSLDIDKVKHLVQRELDTGAGIEAILNDGLIAPMDEAGQRFSGSTCREFHIRGRNGPFFQEQII